MKKTYQITDEGKRELEIELDDLKGRRGDIADKIASARDFGDLSENAEYDAAREEQGLVETRIAEIEDIVKILTFGAAKYAPNNWQLVDNGTDRYYAALMRHLVAWRKGELIDPESGESHLSHAACCLVFLMWLDKQNKDI